MKIDDLEAAMNQFWRQIGSNDNKSEGKDSDDAELVLNAFEGYCFICKKKGHKADKCTDETAKKVCSDCGKRGHIAEDCWLKEENKDKRPANYTIPGEQGAAAVETGSRVELLLCTMDFQTEIELLNDPDVWIGDTGATVHMSPHKGGMTNVRQGSKEDAVTMGNKQVEQATEIADIPGMVCDKNGNKLHRTILKDVAIVPNSGYNLFSLTKMMSDGWILIGEKNSLKLKKDDTEINFDIAIPTPRGMIYAMKIKRDLIPEDGEGTIIQELEKVTEEEEESEDEKLEDTEETTVEPDEITLTQAEVKYYEAMKEFTEREFKAMKGPEKKEWKQAMKEEYNQMMDQGVFEIIPIEDVSEDAKIASSTRTTEKKATGTRYAQDMLFIMRIVESMELL